MKVSDFLNFIFEAHGNTLLRLKELFGEEVLVEVLERAGEKEESNRDHSLQFMTRLNLRRSEIDQSECMHDLEKMVTGMKLTERLEFYLWSYPHYRVFIESDVDLSATITSDSGDVESLVEDAWQNARQWLKSLGMAEPFFLRAEKEALSAWNQFRAKTLRGLGKNPLKAMQRGG